MLLSFYYFCLSIFILTVESKIFTDCELATDLTKNYGVPKDQVAAWVCIAVAESSLNTTAIGPPNTDKSRDYGLFQINSKYWCSGGPQSDANGCHVPCNDLVTDDISKSVTCMKKIIQQQTFSAWTGWNNKCSKEDLSHYISGCKL